MRSQSQLAEQAQAFRAAHLPGSPVILVNVWDVMSARAVESAGYRFLATSSSAVAQSLGEPDTNSMAPAVVFEVIRRIADATSVPLTADIEAGYGLEPARLAEALIASGAVGCNLEDTDHGGDGLIDADEQASRIASLRKAASDLGVELVINARVDSVVRRIGSEEDQVVETVRRGRRYLDSGADCVYPIMLSDEASIAAVAEALDAPLNINLRRGGPSVARLSELGVARISYASGLFRFVEHHLAHALAELRESPDSIF